MKEADYRAACELVLDLDYITAAKFLRAEIGVSLIEAMHLAYNLASEHPESTLADDYKQGGYPEPSRH